MLTELPRTPNGKLDRAALPVPARSESENRSVAQDLPVQQTPIAIVLAAATEILGDTFDNDSHSDRTGASFFELGGDSIAAVRFAEAAAQRGLRFDVADVFDSASLRDLRTGRAGRARTRPVLSGRGRGPDRAGPGRAPSTRRVFPWVAVCSSPDPVATGHVLQSLTAAGSAERTDSYHVQQVRFRASGGPASTDGGADDSARSVPQPGSRVQSPNLRPTGGRDDAVLDLGAGEGSRRSEFGRGRGVRRALRPRACATDSGRDRQQSSGTCICW